MRYNFCFLLLGCSADVFTPLSIEAIKIPDSGDIDSSDIRDSSIDSNTEVLDSSKLDANIIDSSDASDASCGAISSLPSFPACYNANHAAQCPDKSICNNGQATCCYGIQLVAKLSCTITNLGAFESSYCSDLPCKNTICRNDSDCSGKRCYPVSVSDMGWNFGICQ